MVCLGNICRSPMAEAVAGSLVAEAGLGRLVTVDSFGTSGAHVGESADPGALAALSRRGWSLAGHRARQLKAGDIPGIDLVLCADRVNVAAVSRLAPAHTGRIRLLRSFDPACTAGDDEVPDPWGGADHAFDRALTHIEAACRGVIDHVAAARR